MKKTSLNKIGCGSEKENERVPFFFDTQVSDLDFKPFEHTL